MAGIGQQLHQVHRTIAGPAPASHRATARLPDQQRRRIIGQRRDGEGIAGIADQRGLAFITLPQQIGQQTAPRVRLGLDRC